MMTTQTNDNSGGTGYCAGNDFTIKPLTTTVDIKLIRRLMATWHTNGLTDSNNARSCCSTSGNRRG